MFEINAYLPCECTRKVVLTTSFSQAFFMWHKERRREDVKEYPTNSVNSQVKYINFNT